MFRMKTLLCLLRLLIAYSAHIYNMFINQSQGHPRYTYVTLYTRVSITSILNNPTKLRNEHLHNTVTTNLQWYVEHQTLHNSQYLL